MDHNSCSSSAFSRPVIRERTTPLIPGKCAGEHLRDWRKPPHSEIESSELPAGLAKSASGWPRHDRACISKNMWVASAEGRGNQNGAAHNPRETSPMSRCTGWLSGYRSTRFSLVRGIRISFGDEGQNGTVHHSLLVSYAHQGLGKGRRRSRKSVNRTRRGKLMGARTSPI